MSGGTFTRSELFSAAHRLGISRDGLLRVMDNALVYREPEYVPYAAYESEDGMIYRCMPDGGRHWEVFGSQKIVSFGEPLRPLHRLVQE